MLTPAQQERYARHLLLDPLGGEGQERLLDGAVSVRLPAEAAQAARWAVRSLAAAGVGTLILDGPWAEEAAAEARALGPWLTLLQGDVAPEGKALVHITLATGLAAPDPKRITLDPERAADPVSAAAVGSQAALEALKLLAAIGKPFKLPLTGT
ncbi:MAG: hypothetical protein JST92_00525 [Deltaproteobacteria bacterium]|nr:hypothetical protein [Deltaproteobacteria bacterium]